MEIFCTGIKIIIRFITPIKIITKYCYIFNLHVDNHFLPSHFTELTNLTTAVDFPDIVSILS